MSDRRKSSLFYAAKLTEAGHHKASAQLKVITDKWIDEADLAFRLSHAAAEFVAGERTTIEADIAASLTRSGHVEHIRLSVEDFVVHDTEPEVPTLVLGPPNA